MTEQLDMMCFSPFPSYSSWVLMEEIMKPMETFLQRPMCWLMTVLPGKDFLITQQHPHILNVKKFIVSEEM